MMNEWHEAMSKQQDKSSAQLLDELFSGTDSLVRKLTVEEAESSFATVLKEYGPQPIPFGALYPEWSKLKKKIRQGDELWEYKKIWPGGAQAHGVKLLRNGKVLDAVIADLTPVKARRVSKSKRRSS
jgi:hypothetical protein